MSNQPTPPIKMEEKKRGGFRPNARRPLKSPSEGKRRRLPMNLSPSNFEFLEKMGRGKHDYLNYLLDKVREKILNNETNK